MAHSQVRQNFHKDCEDAINKQINLELFCSYTYLCMAYHFQRDDVALGGLFHYWKHASEGKREHAQLLMNILNTRGGRIVLMAIEAPERQEWGTVLEAMQEALELEKRVNESLLHLHSIASGHMDVSLCDRLDNFLQECVGSIREIAGHLCSLKRVGECLGVVMFDHGLRKLSHRTDTSSSSSS